MQRYRGDTCSAFERSKSLAHTIRAFRIYRFSQAGPKRAASQTCGAQLRRCSIDEKKLLEF
jgi:hypothetical protein